MQIIIFYMLLFKPPLEMEVLMRLLPAKQPEFDVKRMQCSTIIYMCDMETDGHYRCGRVNKATLKCFVHPPTPHTER
jgi:hypothetical protein